MIGREAYKIWAPYGVKWTDWVRPVPFISADALICAERIYSFKVPVIDYINKKHDDTAVIVDTPGYEAIEEGLALARFGYRPIPLYNGTTEQNNSIGLVDNSIIATALRFGAAELAKLEIPDDAPPAFLLDSNRLHRYKMDISLFDNSWDIYPQDMPSAGYFINNRIKNIIIRSEKIHIDLSKILFGYQTKGLKIFFTNGYDSPKRVSVKKPKKDRLF